MKTKSKPKFGRTLTPSQRQALAADAKKDQQAFRSGLVLAAILFGGAAVFGWFAADIAIKIWPGMVQ